jgi:hypothetical protein
VLGPELRPDVCGVIFEFYPEESVVVANVDWGADWMNGAPIALITQMLQDGVPVWVMDGKRRDVLLPEGMDENEALLRAQTAWEGVA